MYVIKVERNKDGLFIKTVSVDDLKYGDFLEIKVGGESYPFKITNIFTFGEELDVTAKEVGYFARQLGKKENLDIRTLINSEVSVVTNMQRINEIKEQSSWC